MSKYMEADEFEKLIAGGTRMFIDYSKAKECKNPKVYCICHKCEECGRKFNEHGFMVDDGGTTADFDE